MNSLEGDSSLQEVTRLAELFRQCNALDAEIARLIGRPALAGHLGEYIAARIFDIALVESASNKSVEGYFRSGPFAGRSVNIKLYGQDAGILDIPPKALPDAYLVLTGPRASAVSSRGTARPLVIDAVCLFDAVALVEHLRQFGVKIGIATSVRSALWRAAQIYPEANYGALVLSDEQRRLLGLFGSPVATAS
jgi:hypothetical protein